MKNKIIKALIFMVVCLAGGLIAGFISYTIVSEGSNSRNNEYRRTKIQETQQEVKKQKTDNKQEDRMNFLIAAVEKEKNDMIIYITYDLKEKKLDAMFLPRDTYYRLGGGNKKNVGKLKDVYSAIGIEGLRMAVEDVMEGVNIHHHVIVDSKAFVDIINSIGGVDVTVKENMFYEDHHAIPPLKISFKPGKYQLNGADSLKFVRYISGSGENSMDRGGDIGRIIETQSFLYSAIDKTFSYKLPSVITSAFKYMESSLTTLEIAKLSTSAIGIQKDDIKLHIIPGYMTPEKYYVVDKDKLYKLLEDIYQ